LKEDIENFNGINLSLEIQKDDEYVDDEDTDNQVVFVKATSNGKELGYVVFSIDYDAQGMVLNPQDLEVEERFRGQGVAKTMYDFVKSKGYRIRRSGQQTDAGAGFWAKHRPEQNVWEQNVTEDLSGIDFLDNLLRLLQQQYPDAKFERRRDRVVSLHDDDYDDDDLGVIAGTHEEGDYVGCLMWDVSTGPYTGVLVPAIKLTTEQLLRANPGKKPALFITGDNNNPEAWSHIAQRLGYRLVTDEDELDENFADGKVKGKSRPGRVKRAGASCAGSVSDLRAKARKYGGERGKMYHWCANMKGGRKK